MKTCCTCKETLELDKFYNDKSSKDGKSYRCKECKDRSKKGKISVKKKAEKKEEIINYTPYRNQKITTVEELHDYARRQAAMWLYD